MNGKRKMESNENGSIASARRSVEQARGRLDDERRDAARRELGAWLIRLRENKWLRGPMKGLASLFLGVPLSAGAAELETPAVPTETAAVVMIDEETPNPLPERDETAAAANETDLTFNGLIQTLGAEHADKLSYIEEKATFETRSPEMDRFYLWELSQMAKTIEGGQAAPEYYARAGLPEWTPYQRSLFADAPVQERFTELHPEYRHLSGEQFLDAYPEMLRIATTEFRFSNQYRFLTEDAIDIFASIATTMKPEEALKRYDALTVTIGNDLGLAGVISLTEKVASGLPAGHPILARITKLDVPGTAALVGRSKKNVVHMDQARGQMRVLRKLGNNYVLIDSFPAIGGPLNSPEMSVAGKPSGSEFVHVPDTTMRVAYVDRAKTSWSWHNSWVPAGAPIREMGDELQYRHPRTRQWYDLTGPNAGFFPDKDGDLIRPFDGKVDPMDVGLIRAATHRSADGGDAYVPTAWTKADILMRTGGEIPTEWQWNDFGSIAIRLNAEDGGPTRINIHSKPNEDANGFLPARTHGCLSTFGENVKALVDAYGVGNGSTVVVTTKMEYDLGEMLK